MIKFWGVGLLIILVLIFLNLSGSVSTFKTPLPEGGKISIKQFTPQPLNLEFIFSENSSWISEAPKDKVRVLIATGDIIPARSVNFQTNKYQDFTWAFKKTADVLKSGDITFVNLESPLIKSCPLTNEGMIFCGDERHLFGLTFAGVDVVNLANNHAGNHGLAGLDNTANILGQGGILIAGRSGAVYKDIRGLKFAFLGYNEIGAPEEGISWAENNKVVSEVSEAKRQADVVVVAFHWGMEYISQPTVRQKELGHLAIDSGADLVIGNHPHWVQPVEIYKGKVITYAHGNFIFDQMWSDETREGVVGRYTFYDKQLIGVEFLPVQIDDFGQPHFTEGEQKKSTLEKMESESRKLLGTP